MQTPTAAAADYVAQKIHEVVEDPELAKLLTPKNIIGGKRLCLDTDYHQTFNRDNVTLVDINGTPIEEILPGGFVPEVTSTSLTPWCWRPDSTQ